MKKPFRRKANSPSQDSGSPADGSSPSTRFRAVRVGRTSPAWPYVFWTVVSLLVLLLVINYDRRSSADGMFHLNEGKRLEQVGRVDDAMAEYRLALRNPRLANSSRAEAAVFLAELSVRERGDTKGAIELLNEARSLSFRTSDRLNVPARIKALQDRPSVDSRIHRSTDEAGDGLSRVNLARPAEETTGPVLVTLPSGRTIHQGQLAARLARQGVIHSREFRSNPALLERQLVELVEEELAVDRALASRAHEDGELQAQAWNLYRSLLRARGVQLQSPRATDDETSRAVAAEYERNRDEFIRPARVGVAAILTRSEEEATAARNELHQGRTFDAVATSRSVHRESALKGGYLGLVSEESEDFPILGKQPGLAAKLGQLSENSITTPARYGDHWVIFQVRQREPGRQITLDEARPRLLSRLQARSGASPAPKKLDELQVKPDMKAINQFWKTSDGTSSLPPSTTPAGGIQSQ